MRPMNHVEPIERLTRAQPRRRVAWLPLAMLGLLVAGLWNLAGPAMWWDEGWTLSVARNWVERGFYGRLLDGQLSPPGLEAAFSVTAPVALSFRLLGVGIWQGRLFGVLCMAGALALMYLLAWRLYNRKVAGGTLFVLLLMSMHPQLHPLPMARQVLAETPMLLYLLGGYACLLPALRRSAWWLLPAAALWGLGLSTKLQALPFWALSLAVPMVFALVARRWRPAAIFAGGMAGSVVAYQGFQSLQALILRGHTLPVVPIAGLYNVMAIVLVPFNRLYAAWNILLFGLPTVCGLAYAAWKLARSPRETPDEATAAARLSLLILSGSWLGWYLLLSVGVPRYLFPATFLGSIFVAAWLFELTEGYNLAKTIERAGDLLLKRRLERQTAGALLASLTVAAALSLTILSLYQHYVVENDASAQQVAAFLNSEAPPDARVETYESELHFLLNRPYHYPPDQVHVELNKRSLLQQQVDVAYDPLSADPDYLVVGVFTRWNKLYAAAIASGAFRLVEQVGPYTIYQRVR